MSGWIACLELMMATWIGQAREQLMAPACPACDTAAPGFRCRVCGAHVLMIPAAGDVMTSNNQGSLHPNVRAVAAWREAAFYAAKGARIPRMQRAHIYAHWLRSTRRGRHDPGNAYPTHKACIDGFVDAKVLPDDNAKHVVGPDPRWGPTARVATVAYALVPLDELRAA